MHPVRLTTKTMTPEIKPSQRCSQSLSRLMALLFLAFPFLFFIDSQISNNHRPGGQTGGLQFKYYSLKNPATKFASTSAPLVAVKFFTSIL
jgi:hypothetical protein